MKAFGSFQNKTLVAVASAAVLVLGFQNCSKGSSQLGDSSTPTTGTPAADHDPLKATSSESPGSAPDLSGSGPLYTLIRVDSAAGPLQATEGVFKIRLNEVQSTTAAAAALTPDPILTNFNFSAEESCDTFLDGAGQMTRLRGLPVAAGAVNFNIQSRRTVADASCPALSASDQKLLQEGDDNFETLLKGVRAFTIFREFFVLVTHDGHALTFKIQHSDGTTGTNPPPTAGNALGLPSGLFEATGWEGNLCPETASAQTVCTQVYGLHTLTAQAHRLNLRADGSFSLRTGSHYYRGTLRLAATGPGGLRKIGISVENFAAVETCQGTSVAASDAEVAAVTTLLQNAAFIAATGQPATALNVFTAKGNLLKARLIGESPSSTTDECW